MKPRKYSALDRGIMVLDSVLSGIIKVSPGREKRLYPGASHSETNLDANEKRHVSGLMRVNHAGEIAAQGLYKAQSFIVKDEKLKKAMQQSADEEMDHLEWCELRLNELGEHPSYLGPIWYLGSFGMGVVAGCFGDKWNLGFLAETEYQVVTHLDEHIKQLPMNDNRSRSILEKMREDELHHATAAEIAGANVLPKAVKVLMTLTSKIMTKTAYRF